MQRGFIILSQNEAAVTGFYHTRSLQVLSVQTQILAVGIYCFFEKHRLIGFAHV